jgi:SDR family mycofactocin-dependent oxidoreductase
MGLLEGKVVLISGAARGQGRSHAVRLAEEGADIIAFDICADIATIPYPLGQWSDLIETAKLVKQAGGRIVISRTDVRDAEAVHTAVDAGVAELGRLDIIIANAGVTSYAPAQELSDQAWRDVIDVDLTGAWNTARAGLRHLLDGGRGGSIIFTSSSMAHYGVSNIAAYSAAKAGLVGLMQSLAVELGPHMIRVNTVHPTGVITPMIRNQATIELFLPGSNLTPETMTDADWDRFKDIARGLNVLPIPWMETVDVSNALIYLTSDQGRYVSGTQLRIDAASAAR